MFKSLFAATLLAFSANVTSDPFEFKQPEPKVSDQMYKEAIKEYGEGNVNAKIFIDGMRKGWEANQKRQGLDEPEDIFMGCVLYQVGGMEALNNLNFAHVVRVLGGLSKEKGTGDYTEEDAKNLVQHWTPEQKETGMKLYIFMEEYGQDCYKYVHQGFTAGIPKMSLENATSE